MAGSLLRKAGQGVGEAYLSRENDGRPFGKERKTKVVSQELWGEYGKAHVTRGGHSLAIQFNLDYAGCMIYLPIPPGWPNLEKDVPVLVQVSLLSEAMQPKEIGELQVIVDEELDAIINNAGGKITEGGYVEW